MFLVVGTSYNVYFGFIAYVISDLEQILISNQGMLYAEESQIILAKASWSGVGHAKIFHTSKQTFALLHFACFDQWKNIEDTLWALGPAPAK